MRAGAKDPGARTVVLKATEQCILCSPEDSLGGQGSKGNTAFLQYCPCSLSNARFSPSICLNYSEVPGVSQEGENSPCWPSTTRGHLKDIGSTGVDLLWSSIVQALCVTPCTRVRYKAIPTTLLFVGSFAQ